MINKVRKDIEFSDAAVDRDTSGKKLVISWEGQGDSENIDICVLWGRTFPIEGPSLG